MSRLHYIMPALMLIAALAACGDDTGGDADATTPTADGPTAIDGAAMVDAPPSMPDASPPVDAMSTTDATPPSPDATPFTSDAGASDIPTVCNTICNHLFACFMEPPDPSCATECSLDLADCTTGQIDAVNACSMVDCSSDPMAPITCLEAITCINP